MADHQNVLRALFNNNQLEPFIRHVRFPRYKNLGENAVVEFNYPITVLVGPNGTNKSSILRALYGVPGQNNVGNFWFSTNIDPIEEGDGKPNCFIYGYVNNEANKIVEVLKTRIKKEEDPDYWEPSRPILSYGMEPVPKGGAAGATKTRWKPINKNVVFIDFRAALSAFDKFFYHGELRSKSNSFRNKKDLLRSRSPHLKKAVDEGLKTLSFHKSERIVNGENIVLNDIQRQCISEILGREYTEIRLIRHRFFNGDGYTAQLKTNSLRYTEAFAGSGEFAVVTMVTRIIDAPQRSLILLDEPEVSLHPGAQERLMNFLATQVKIHKHQIVICSHSPTIVRNLPPEAIKILVMDTATGKITVPRQSALSEEAFFHLGEPIHGKKTVIVEDKLAKSLLEKCLRSAGEAIFKLFDVIYFPGGASTLWTNYIPVFAAEEREDIFIYLDGDQEPEENFSDPDNIGPADSQLLIAAIARVTKADVKFPVDGGANGADVVQLDAARRRYIKWARAYVSYLPCKTPEEFVWTRSKGIKPVAGEDYKKKFEESTKKMLGYADYESVTASEILLAQRQELAKISDEDQDIVNITQSLHSFAVPA